MKINPTRRTWLCLALALMLVAVGALIVRPGDTQPSAVASEDRVTVASTATTVEPSTTEAAPPSTAAQVAVTTTVAPPAPPTTIRPVARKPKPAPVVPAPATSSGGSRWDALAQCETGGNWSHPPVAGGYSGGTMTLASTWRSYGGLAFAPAAYLATKAQQITVNERILADVGWGAWPGCSRKLGWR